MGGIGVVVQKQVPAFVAGDMQGPAIAFQSIVTMIMACLIQPTVGAVSDAPAGSLSRDPGLDTISPLQRLLARCLERDPKTRLRDIGEARVEIDRTIAGTGDVAVASVTSSATSAGSGRRLAWMAFAVATVGVLAAAALSIPAVRHLRETLPPEMRVELSTPSTLQPLQFALSPDGRQIVFVASGTGRQRLWLRALDAIEAQPLAGTEGAEYPFWSPDGRSLGFFAMGKLYRLDIAGGSSQPLTTTGSGGRGGAWSADGTILFARSATSGLSRIAATGRFTTNASSFSVTPY